MLDISYIREHKDAVKKNCANRRVTVDIDRLLSLDEERRQLVHDRDELRAKKNKTSKAKPSPEEIVAMRAVGDQIKVLDVKFDVVLGEYQDLLTQVPNLTSPDAPIGGEEDFRVVEVVGKAPQFRFTPKDHEEILRGLDLIDFERGAKVTGAKFYFAKNDLVRLNQALINYGLDIVAGHGYTILETPDLAKDEILSGVGFNPRGKETQVYSIEGEPLSLIGTAEITVGGYHAGEVLDLSAGPKKYVALSHCFRTEAGAYGRTSKGLYRVHQFTKLEMFIFCRPEDSEANHAELLEIEREIVDGLGLPYRVIDIASADLGGPAYRKFDLEAWMVMKNDYGEITSTSNCTDYQARRLGITYKKESGESAFVHTLNGTAVTTSRIPLAIVENYQRADGRIDVPKALRPYLGKKILG